MLSDEQVELFAIRAAKGNNGGKWSEHYTDDQKEYWRRFVRDLAETIQGVKDGDLSLGPRVEVSEADFLDAVEWALRAHFRWSSVETLVQFEGRSIASSAWTKLISGSR